MAWFDRPENQPGILTARLATEVQNLQRLTGTGLAVVLEGVAVVVAALFISFLYSWKMALLEMSFLPAIVLFGFLQVTCTVV